jgi:UDP-GlcNAc:undecaprenyl-phosphate/decaprenyl-phosphate GlcNAc-1-phosphate transferase
MEVVVGAGAGAVVAAGLWLALRGTFAAPLFARSNHRGASVPTGAGIIVALTLLFLSALERGIYGLGIDQDALHAGSEMVLAVVGFGLLGFIDDVAEVGTDKGFAGHLRALRHGRLTTGALKLFGGVAVAVGAVAVFDAGATLDLVVDVLLVAGAANVGNLLDRAPGRTTKVALVVGALVLALTWSAPPLGLAIVLGAALGLLAFDLREELMLGDAGANALGAALGLAVVFGFSFPVRVGALAVVIALNALSEVVSFSAVIAKTPGLKQLDQLGRRP